MPSTRLRRAALASVFATLVFVSSAAGQPDETSAYLVEAPRVDPLPGGLGLVWARVRVAAYVTAAGRADTVRIVRGVHPEIDRAVLGVAGRARFAPARRAGRAVATWTVVDLDDGDHSGDERRSADPALRLDVSRRMAEVPVPPDSTGLSSAQSARRGLFVVSGSAACATGERLRAPIAVRRVSPETNGDMHSGLAVLRLVIDATGAVTSAEVASATDRALGIAARRAFARWRYAPALCGDVPVAVVVEERFRFQNMGRVN